MNELWYEVHEQWRVIDYYDIKFNMYAVSTYGNVKNIVSGKFLSKNLSNGYLTVSLQCDDGKRKTFYIHRLVAMSFIYNDDPHSKTQVNHKNMCRCDNFVDNLEWCTQLENIKHEIENRGKNHFKLIEQYYSKNKGWKSGKETYGENNGMSKFTEQQVFMICDGVEKGMNYAEALAYAGLPNTENNRYNVSHIIRGHRWKHISSQFNFNI